MSIEQPVDQAPTRREIEPTYFVGRRQFEAAEVYVVTATVAGLAGDREAGSSHAALAVSAAQWTASGFLPMTAATVLAIAVTAIRWFAQSRVR